MELLIQITHIAFVLLSIMQHNKFMRIYLEAACFFAILACVTNEYVFILIALFKDFSNLIFDLCCESEKQIKDKLLKKSSKFNKDLKSPNNKNPSLIHNSDLKKRH